MSDDQDSETRFDKHPALRNFNRAGVMFSKGFKQTLKWGVIGAIAAVAALAAITVAGAWSMPVVTIATGLLGYVVPGLAAPAAGFALTTAAYFAAAGGVIGAAAGAIVGISGASEAADAEEDRLVAKFEQAEARRDRMIALERRRDEQRFAMENQEYAMRGPGQQIPQGRAAAQRLGNAPTV